MNGVHDMGGMHGFGPVVREENEPVFHEDWERRTRAMVVALSKKQVTNLDEFRYAIERIKPQHYLSFSYYERWLFGLLIVIMKDFGLTLDDSVEIRVWDSIADTRYLVLPERPAGTEQLSEEQLAAFISRDALVGVAKVTVDS